MERRVKNKKIKNSLTKTEPLPDVKTYVLSEMKLKGKPVIAREAKQSRQLHHCLAMTKLTLFMKPTASMTLSSRYTAF